MPRSTRSALFPVLLPALLSLSSACASSSSTSPQQPEQEDMSGMYAQWSLGPPATADYFPIAVWLQDPANATRYQEAGINLYVGLWQGPTLEQLSQLTAAHMAVICAQNQVGLEYAHASTIVGWMHGDEPDNAQWNAATRKYDAPITPAVIMADYARIHQRDPSRPILLNLGQGVAWDGYVGRGVRTHHPEDYAEYLRGADIASFDIYPVASTREETHGKLWLVANGVQRLREWSRPDQPVWNCIECTRIYAERNKATPQQVKAEVWMSLVHGSQGLIYFVHEWKPAFNEHALLDDPVMLAAVTAINQRIHLLAPVLNGPTLSDAVQVTLSNPQVPVATMVKRQGDVTFLFAVAMRSGTTQVTFTLADGLSADHAEVLDESRQLEVRQHTFTDAFAPFAVHLYRLE